MRLDRVRVPRLYGLTHPIPGVDEIEVVRRLASSGLRWIQIREKGSDDLRLCRLVERAIGISPSGVDLLVNDRVDVALACGAFGVHLGDRDLPAAVARRVAGSSELMIGVSTHGLVEAVAAAEDEAVDYVAIGPIFRSTTKDVRQPLGLGVIRELRKRTDKLIIAIGGIGSENIGEVLASGADSAAVIAALYRDGEIERNVGRLLEAAKRA